MKRIIPPFNRNIPSIYRVQNFPTRVLSRTSSITRGVTDWTFSQDHTRNDDVEWREERRGMKKGHLNKKDLFLHRPSYSSVFLLPCAAARYQILLFLRPPLRFGQPPSVFFLPLFFFAYSLFVRRLSRPGPIPKQIRPIRTQALHTRRRSSLSNQPLQHDTLSAFFSIYADARARRKTCVRAHPRAHQRT